MRKYISIFIIMALFIGLVGCNRGPKDLEITIVNEVVASKEILVDAIVPNNIKTIDELEEIAYNIVSQVYEKHFETIGSSTYVLTLNLYQSQQDYDGGNKTYGTIKFDINKSITLPGLQLNTNNLTVK